MNQKPASKYSALRSEGLTADRIAGLMVMGAFSGSIAIYLQISLLFHLLLPQDEAYGLDGFLVTLSALIWGIQAPIMFVSRTGQSSIPTLLAAFFILLDMAFGTLLFMIAKEYSGSQYVDSEDRVTALFMYCTPIGWLVVGVIICVVSILKNAFGKRRVVVNNPFDSGTSF
jgi:hypothetical protein